jgi:hypothetical protein
MIAQRIAAAQGPLFTTNADGLYAAYLDNLPSDRQHYTCHSCRRFIERYGGLAVINDDGSTKPALWGVVDGFFLGSCVALGNMVCRAKVTGVFLSPDKVWGTPQTSAWSHLSGQNPQPFKHALHTADQVMAEKLQDYIMLHKGLAEIPLEAVIQAVRVLEADAVDRSEKTLGVAKWLLALHQSIADVRGPRRDNLIWLAVATAPPGWCHVRSTMIATLLDDVIQGLPFDAIRRRWNEKMHPLQYQRPTAPPKEGNIDAANKIIAKLQAEGALARRFARLDEITALWRPREIEVPPKKAGGGAFDHLKGTHSTVKEVELPAKAMVWEKFRDDILPNVQNIEVLLTGGMQGFYGLTTAVNADAPAMLQWDGLDGLPRNPVAWYFYMNGGSPQQWGLSPGWTKVDSICRKPCDWQSDKFAHQGGGIFFVLSDARDSREGWAGFFPETLRAEYHGIRSVIEAHSRASKLAGLDEGNANGIALDSRHTLTVRVRGKDGTASYTLSL